jgi:hypothetical protein
VLLPPQLACYNGGLSRYVAHVDANLMPFREQGLLAWLSSRVYRQRVITVILYLNEPTWDKEHGGALRVYDRRDDLEV